MRKFFSDVQLFGCTASSRYLVTAHRNPSRFKEVEKRQKNAILLWLLLLFPLFDKLRVITERGIGSGCQQTPLFRLERMVAEGDGLEEPVVEGWEHGAGAVARV